MQWNLAIKRMFQAHLPLYLFVSALFVMGVIFGALLVNALTLEQKREMANVLGSFFNMLNQGSDQSYGQAFTAAFGAHLKWILLIWMLGLSVVGFPLILVLDFLKGILIGFSVGFLVSELSWEGMLVALVSIAPQNLIFIPCIIICSAVSITFANQVIKQRLIGRSGTLADPFKQHVLTVLSITGIVVGISLFEAFVTPQLLKWAAPVVVN